MPNIALIEGNKLSDSGSDLTAISAQTYARLHSGRDFPNGTLIETTIDYSVTNGDPWVLEITGNAYFSLIPFDLKYQGYIYNNTVTSQGGISVGAPITGMSLFNYNGKLCFWFPYQSYWQGFNVYVYSALSGRKENRVTAITNVAKPAGITKEVSMTFQQVVRTSSSTVGTTNYVSKFSANNVLTDSQIFDNGTNVGIGTASPFSKFTVSTTASASQISIVNTEGGHFILRSGIPGVSNSGASFVIANVDGSNQNTRMVISATGDVGINTTSPAGKLDVVGASTYLGIGSSSDTFLYLRGYNNGLTRFQTNAGFSGTYNGLSITTNSNGVNSLPSWNFDFGGQDGVNFISDAFTIARKPNGGSYSTFVTIRNTGNFGIATTSPLTPLHVYRSIAGTIEADRTTPLDVLTLESENTTQTEFTGFGQAIVFRGSTYNNSNQRTIGRILHQINDNSSNTTIGTSLDIQLLTNATGSTLASRFYIGGTGIITIPNLAGTGSRIVVADASGALSATTLSTSIVGGSGTVNRVAKFTATGTVGDSQIFDNGTSVGIGTVSPAAKLDIRGTSTQDIYLISTTTSNVENSIQSYFNNGGGWANFGVKSQNLILYTGPSGGPQVERLYITSTGNVGIGTTSPNSELQIGSTSTNGNRTISITDAGYGLRLAGGGGPTNNYIQSIGTAIPLYFLSGNANNGNYVFSSTGRMGIGSTSPGGKVHIKQAASEIPLLIDSSASANAAYTQYLVGASGGWEVGMAGSGDSYKWFFSYGGFGSTNAKVTITSGGLLGVGTVSPAYKVDTVVGTNGVDGYNVYGAQGGVNEVIGYRAHQANGIGLVMGVTGAGASSALGGANQSVIYGVGSQTLILGTNSTARLTIFNNGRVFVGPSAADGGYQFDVNGTTRFGGTATFNSTIVQKTFSTIVITNLAASGTQARQFEILRGFYDFNDWSTSGVVEIEVYENYYSRGLKKVYTFSYGYFDSSSLFLTEMTGTGDNTFRVTMGAKVLISGDMYYVPVYVEARGYGAVDVVIRTRRTLTTNNLSTVPGTLYVNETPTAVNISDFTSDTIVYPNNAAANQVVLGNLGIGSNPSYKLDVDGVTRFRNFVRFKTNVWNLSDEGQSRFYYENAGSTFYGTGSSHIWRSSADVTLMTLTSTGNLGIATTTPQSLLSISNNHATLLSIGNSAWANKNVLLTNYNGTVGDYTELLVPGSASNSALLRLTSGGSLGLGIATPTFVTGTGLHVKTAGDANIRITSGSNTGFDLVQAVDGTNYIYNRDNSPFIFGTNNTERLRIAANGSVTIYNATTLSNLAGTGTRMVVADANGLLSTQAIPSGGGGGTGTVTSVGLVIGTSGTDVNVSNSPITSSGNITLNIPDASTTARGLINTGTQTFAGDKTFTGQTTLNVTRTSATNGSYGMYMLTTYNFAAGDANKNIYTSVDSLVLNLTNGALSGSQSYNVTANLNQVSVGGNATTISTQPLRGIIMGLLGIPGGTPMNIADFRYMEAKIPDNAALSGHVVTSIFGIRIGSLKGTSGFTITNGWGVYQEGIQDNNYFAGNVVIGSTTVGSYKLDVTNNFRVNTGTVPVAIESFANPGIGTVASVYSTGSASTIAFGSQANDTYLVGGYVFIGNQSAKFMIQGDTITGAYDGWGSIGSSAKYMKEVYTNYLVDKVNFNRQTASYTLVSGDRNKLIEMNVGSANTLTVPTNASVAFPIGTQLTIVQYGAGQTTIAGAGVTFRSTNNWLKINAQYGSATLVKVGTDEWYVIGNLSA